ncbi:MAG: transposase zinc-binding domain-containing protein [Verrucomicrobia bacterium]|nr:transposase zinc-binding domain-containing protein [Verrucomicrobiota bacterium]
MPPLRHGPAPPECLRGRAQYPSLWRPWLRRPAAGRGRRVSRREFECRRHLCPACHQSRVRQTADWISTSVCHEVPHRQFVFTIPKILRGIFRKRRDLLHLLFKTATATLLESFRARLNLPDGRLAAVAAGHPF